MYHFDEKTRSRWTPSIDECSVFDVNPEMSHESWQLFTRFRLLSIAGLFLAMLGAALLAG